MPDQAVTVGFFGKLPAHGDFVRRGLAGDLVGRLDDWLQAGFGRSDDPVAAITALAPLRFASCAMADGMLALGTMVASRDRIGRAYVVVGLRLSPHPSAMLGEPLPPAWDDWCGRVEAVLLAAQAGAWTADATQAALETAARAAVVALGPPVPLGVPDDAAATAAWRPSLAAPVRVARIDGLPHGDGFDRFIAAEND